MTTKYFRGPAGAEAFRVWYAPLLGGTNQPAIDWCRAGSSATPALCGGAAAGIRTRSGRGVSSTQLAHLV